MAENAKVSEEVQTTSNPMEEINQYSKNDELIEAIGSQLKSGRVVPFFISEPTEGKDGENYQQIYLAQERQVERENSGQRKVQEMFLGWSQKRIVRAIQNAKPEQLEALGIVPGKPLSAQFNIQLNYSDEPFYPEQNPRVYPESSRRAGELITSGGNPVYENAELIHGKPMDNLDDYPTDSVDTATGEILENVAKVEKTFD